MAESETLMQTVDPVPPPDMEDWSRDQVREWALKLRGVDLESAEILFNQKITGMSLKPLNITEMTQMGMKYGPAKIIFHAKNEMQEIKERLCKPFPASDFYTEDDILSVVESGALDLIEPCHEFKSLQNTTNRTKMIKFKKDIIPFAAGCMNSHTNGTIHFGILDKPHGKICGVPVDTNEKELYELHLREAVDKSFPFKHKNKAKSCIKPPRFVEVLNKDSTPTGKFVIEVDVVPLYTMCKHELFHTYDNATQVKQFFIRDGSSSRDLLKTNTADKKKNDYKWFVDNVDNLSELRKQSEEKHRSKDKGHMQGSKLGQMITGGTGSLDSSYYKFYIIVSNEPLSIHPDAIPFFLDPMAVCGFHYKLTKKGQFYIENNDFQKFLHKVIHRRQDKHSFKPMWAHVHSALCQTTLPFLCEKCLVVFLVSAPDMDAETFSTFYPMVKDTRQMLCICSNENAFTCLKRSIEARCNEDITDRSIYELSKAEVKGTVLSLLSEKRRSSRFLPGAGGSRVILEEEVEHRLTTLDVLCVNQCEGESEDQVSIEQNFSRGGKVSWWNFHFSEQSGSHLLIKSHQLKYITDTIIPELGSKRKACVLLNIKHEPRSGGTTLAKQTLWALRETHRCAELNNNEAELETVAEHVVALLECGCAEQKPPVPVLLMIDDCGDMKKVLDLQQIIEEQCLRSSQARFPQVILLNCLRSTLDSGPFDPTEDTVFIKDKLFKDHKCQVPEESRTPPTSPIKYSLLSGSPLSGSPPSGSPPNGSPPSGSPPSGSPPSG